ncbi:hypothetical protein P7K49_032333 [Saguinus oedipus]|uniref:Uncharacterized protein n=1 Tax=Saguinus oedipus TaxID=9490 RepID=A0ABQ9TXY8_SAGOE|nr:hypothetical protein P7K49_032333 [Saguinus oedipus]
MALERCRCALLLNAGRRSGSESPVVPSEAMRAVGALEATILQLRLESRGAQRLRWNPHNRLGFRVLTEFHFPRTLLAPGVRQVIWRPREAG